MPYAVYADDIRVSVAYDTRKEAEKALPHVRLPALLAKFNPTLSVKPYTPPPGGPDYG